MANSSFKSIPSMYKYIYWTKLGEDRRSFDRGGNLSGEGGENCPVILFFPPGQTSPLRTCVCRRRYRPPARLELRNCRCPAAYLDPSNFRKQAGSWPQKGGWSFRGTLSKTCRSDTSRRERSSNSGRRNDPNFPREYRQRIDKPIRSLSNPSNGFPFFEDATPSTFSFVNSN